MSPTASNLKKALPPATVPEDRKFPVVEIFGPTIQGEGALAGRPTHFVRFGGCDFSCSWCDSSHAVLPEEVRKAEKLTSMQIEHRVLDLPGQPGWVTLSGGNPALLGLNFVVRNLQSSRFQVTVETQGSTWKPWLGHLDALTVSPKPPSSGMKNPFLSEFLDNARDTPLIHSEKVGLSMKVPIFNEEDYDWARRLHDAEPDIPFYLSVVTRMGGLHGDFDDGRIDTRDDIIDRYRWLVEKVVRDAVFGDIAVFPQLHAILWGHDRGH